MRNAVGGNLLLSGSAGIILPYPLSRDNVEQPSLLMRVTYLLVDTLPAITGIFGGPLRYSAGLSFEWRSPFGPLAFSVAKAIESSTIRSNSNSSNLLYPPGFN